MTSLQRLISFATLCIASNAAFCQHEKEMQSVSLDTVLVSSRRNTSNIRSSADGTIAWDMKAMNDLPKILGNADPLHYAQMLPGVQTNGEYRGGINIQGCDNSHNYVSIADAPIYNVNHLLGFFSTFNSSHFSSLTLQKNASATDAPNRIGGVVTMEPFYAIPDSLHGELSVGLMSSQGTIRMPLGKQTALTISLRDSYLNLLYGRWLMDGSAKLKYSFYDTNATLVHHIDHHNTIALDHYSGDDHATLSHERYLGHAEATWGNTMTALHWIASPSSRLRSKSTIFHSAYKNRLKMQMMELLFKLPSHISEVGFRNTTEWNNWQFAASASLYDIRPQAPSIEGTFNNNFQKQKDTSANETSLSASYKQDLWGGVAVVPSLSCSSFSSGGTRFWAADPSATVMFSLGDVLLEASYFNKHQYLFQAGFSDMGLPTEFWFSSGLQRKPQHAHGASLRASSSFARGMYRLSAELFYKKLCHQQEYVGTPFDFLEDDYSLEKTLQHGKGENYGLNAMFSKCAGALTGWVSYSYTHAKRRFPLLSASHEYPANHERPHEIDALATYKFNRHWDAGFTFVFASGTPFTAPKSFYLLNNSIVAEYGEHNANRLNPYSRLDLSCNYKWTSRKGLEQGVNISVYNALFRKNELFYYISTHSDGDIAYRPTSFIINALPSVSYFLKF